jgi:hypothetical protein
MSSSGPSESKKIVEHKNVMGHVYRHLSNRQLTVCCFCFLTFNGSMLGIFCFSPFTFDCISLVFCLFEIVLLLLLLFIFLGFALEIT